MAAFEAWGEMVDKAWLPTLELGTQKVFPFAGQGLVNNV